LLRKQEQLDNLRLLAPEILNEILSHFTLKDLSVLSRTCTWLHNRIAHHRVTVRVEEPLLITEAKASYSRLSSCSYSCIRRQLNQQARHEREELERLYEALIAIMMLAFIVLGPMAVGFIMRLCGFDIFSGTIGISSSALGTLVSAGIMLGFADYMLWQTKYVTPAPHVSHKKREHVVKEGAIISAIQKL